MDRDRQGEKRCPERYHLRPGQVILLQAAEQAVEPGLRRVVLVEGESPLVEVDGRVQPRVLETRRAAPLDDGRVHLAFGQLPEDVLLQRVDQARLAQAWLADEENDLAHALLGLLPALF